MKKLKTAIILTFASTILLSSCKKSLDHFPDHQLTADQVYTSASGYKNVLAKVYGAYTLTSNNGNGSNDGDIDDINVGMSDFLRLYFNVQELTTDEAIQGQNDPGLLDLHAMNWTSNNTQLRAMYARSFYQIAVCNEFIREASDEKLNARGITGADANQVKAFRAEARFLRAFQYWVLLDLFGNPAFVDENTPVGKTIPPRITRKELFAYIESELKTIEPQLIAAKQNEYGRADRAAAQALLARLYLNAEIYLGSGNGKYAEAITYAEKVIASGFSLNSSYSNLFRADNNLNNSETILAIPYDGLRTLNWGGTTYIMNAGTGSGSEKVALGIPNGGWSQMRATRNLPDLFSAGDGRAMFYGTKADIDVVSLFSDGLAVQKYKNITATNITAPSTNGTFASVDFPLFRLAEMYLIYAEANLRGGGGNASTALQNVNLLRRRAYGNNSADFTSLTLNDIIDERGRELYWEASRRTDLIRFGRFTSNSYLWPWKGNLKAGKEVESFRSLFPISSADLLANTNLIQNTGY